MAKSSGQRERKDETVQASASRQERNVIRRFTRSLAQRHGQAYYGILFILPGLVVYLLFMIYPFFNTMYSSLTRWSGASPEKDFVGLANYVRMFKDEAVLTAFWHNIIWVIIGTISPVVIGLFLALLLWTGARGALVFRTIYFLPFVLPLVVISIVWRWIYHPLFGPLNNFLDSIGLDQLSRGWLGDPKTALYAVLIPAIWAYTGFVLVVVLAALQSVDMSLVEAARLDGANWFQRIWHIVLPLIAPVITMVTAVTLIGGFNVFDLVYVMSGGGPGISSEVLGTYTYKIAFQQNQAGYGSALAVLITMLSMVAAVTFVRLRERQEHDE